MTALVILAFAIPLAVLIRQSVESKALDEARFTTLAAAQYISAVDPDGDEVSTYLQNSEGRFAGTTWVEFPDGSVAGTPPAGWESVDDDAGSPSAATRTSGAPTQQPPSSPPSHAGDEGHNGHGPGDITAPTITHWNGGAVTSADAMTVNGPSTVYTYLSQSELRDGLLPQLLMLAGASLLLLLLSFVGAEALARRLTRPLEQTAAAAQRLAAGDTSARAPETGPPEVAQVGSALNGLADRIDEVISVEREAVADLSHRLRTPLTALKLDVDALEDRETSIRLASHVGVLERTLTAIIHAARRPSREGRVPQSDAVDVVRERAAYWAPLVEDQGRDLGISLPEQPMLVRASHEDLAVAVDALIENVIAHTPDGAPFDVAVGVTDVGQVAVTVSDTGSGIPADAGLRGRSDRGSSGLGLDIARHCAEASGGSMRIFHREPHGAVVELLLGRS
jgi:signal transduction histidine kinase